MLCTKAVQNVRFPVLFPLKGFCIELASMGSVSIYIHHQIAVIVTTSDDVNRHSSSFKMATVLKEWTKEESAFCHYQETVKRLKKAVRRRRPGLLTKGLGVLLLHDGAGPHSAATTVNLLNYWGWKILPHPPYSPDLAPSNLHLFSKMKTHLRGQRCHYNEDVQNEVKKWSRDQDAFLLWTWQIDMSL
jgi:transposase